MTLETYLRIVGWSGAIVVAALLVACIAAARRTVRRDTEMRVARAEKQSDLVDAIADLGSSLQDWDEARRRPGRWSA